MSRGRRALAVAAMVVVFGRPPRAAWQSESRAQPPSLVLVVAVVVVCPGGRGVVARLHRATLPVSSLARADRLLSGPLASLPTGARGARYGGVARAGLVALARPPPPPRRSDGDGAARAGGRYMNGSSRRKVQPGFNKDVRPALGKSPLTDALYYPHAPVGKARSRRVVSR